MLSWSNDILVECYPSHCFPGSVLSYFNAMPLKCYPTLRYPRQNTFLIQYIPTDNIFIGKFFCSTAFLNQDHYLNPLSNIMISDLQCYPRQMLFWSNAFLVQCYPTSMLYHSNDILGKYASLGGPGPHCNELSDEGRKA